MPTTSSKFRFGNLVTYLLHCNIFGLWVYITSKSFDEKWRVNWNVVIFLIIQLFYWWSIGTELNGLRDISIQVYIKHGLDLSGSCDLIGHVTI